LPHAGGGRDAAGRPWGGLLESPHSGRAYRTLAAPVAALGRACGIVPTARVACVWELESPHSGRAYRTLAAPVAAHWAALGRACGIVPTARVACVWDLGPCEEGGSDV